MCAECSSRCSFCKQSMHVCAADSTCGQYGRSGYLGKENEVLETGVQVSFGLELTNLVKV